MTTERETTIGPPINGTYDGMHVTYIVDGVIESYDSETGIYRIRGNSRGAQHIDWIHEAHWGTDFYAKETP